MGGIETREGVKQGRQQKNGSSDIIGGTPTPTTIHSSESQDSESEGKATDTEHTQIEIRVF